MPLRQSDGQLGPRAGLSQAGPVVPIPRYSLKSQPVCCQVHASRGRMMGECLTVLGWAGRGCGMEDSRGLVRRVSAGTPEGRARPPREGQLASLGCHPHGKVSGWGAESCNPVTWSSGGQTVPCDRYQEKKEATSVPGCSPGAGFGRRAVLRLVHGPGWRRSLLTPDLHPDLGVNSWASRACCLSALAARSDGCKQLPVPLFCYRHDTQPGMLVKFQWFSRNSSE